MNSYVKFLLAISTVLFLACSGSAQDQSPSQKNTFQNIDVAEFNQVYINAAADTVILDVRTQQEVDAGKIPGAIHIDVLKPDFKSKVAELDTSKTYVVYCRSGRRSVTASNIMVNELDFNDVKNLEGGYNAWNR